MKTILKFFQTSKNTADQLVAVEDNHPAKDNLFRVEWNLGKRCNYDCSYCSPSIHDKKSPHLDMSVIESTLDKILAHGKKTKKKVRISLTGGEPYLHPKFFDIIKHFKEKGVHRISVTSNGSLPSQKYIDSLLYVDYLILSIHFEYTQVESLLSKVKQIHSHLSENKNLHLHIMAIPTRVSEALTVAREMESSGISYALRRVRPQFNSQGTYLKPFNSGSLGDNKAQWEKIKLTKDFYYSQEELQDLGAFS